MPPNPPTRDADRSTDAPPHPLAGLTLATQADASAGAHAAAAGGMSASNALRPLRWGIAGAVLLLLVAAGAAGLPRLVAALGPAVSGALIGGLVAAGATAAGTLPVALSRRMSRRSGDALLGFGAGVMLAASVFSLIIPALQQTRLQGAGPWMSGFTVGIAILIGAAMLLALGRIFGHDHGAAPGSTSDPASHDSMHKAWLFAVAITLHNIPEGAAIGVAFAGLDHVGAMGLATGIAIQDVPEGLAIALTLRAAGRSRKSAVGWGAASGLVEPVFAVLGAALVQTFTALLPWGLAGAAGAMLFVIAKEVIPESHKNGHGALASAALMVGFVVMLLLDTSMN